MKISNLSLVIFVQWQKQHCNLLARYLKSIGEIKTWITIPYLYGAYQHLGYHFGNIEELLKIVLAAPGKELPLIYMCDEIKFDVLLPIAREEVTRDRENQYKVRIPGDAEYPLIVGYNTILGKDLKSLSYNLTIRYQAFIEDNTYSWSHGEKRWKKFEVDDLKKIDQIR